MRVLLDECVPHRLTHGIVGHDVHTVAQMNWNGKRNGELLSLASQQFDAFVTVDTGIQFQQDLEKLSIGVIVLRARDRIASRTCIQRSRRS